ncbi:hypothetical protein RB468 [Rhodopirellula baltica SH 1]|uniref:Uncharacterized protein n=1 Tax=Rhodopirellula baltica (strain DSM 10527 / NCIMB 13988 / SH1) TaxID=243090 RepID=Q7UYP1_RHOBA|nr:hypothetical protein RB468 [Rhodopirellula baltica SH 1]
MCFATSKCSKTQERFIRRSGVDHSANSRQNTRLTLPSKIKIEVSVIRGLSQVLTKEVPDETSFAGDKSRHWRTVGQAIPCRVAPLQSLTPFRLTNAT